MKQQNIKNINHLVKDLQERTKELTCLYRIEELLMDIASPLEDLFRDVVHIIPSGWQYAEVCKARLNYMDDIYQSDGFIETPWSLSAEVRVQGKSVGRLSVYYIKEVPAGPEGYFLREEIKLINTIADRIGFTIFHKTMKQLYKDWEEAKEELSEKGTGEWRVVVDMLMRTDRQAYAYILQKMLHTLCQQGVDEANRLLQQSVAKNDPKGTTEINRPAHKQTKDNIVGLSEEIFKIASRNIKADEIFSLIQKWLQQDKLRFFIKTVDNPNTSLNEIIHAIIRYQYLEAEGAKLSPSIEKGLRVCLIRRFFSDQLEFINIAKNHIEIRDYYDLVNRIIFPLQSRGKLGGKTAGMILAARIVSQSGESAGLFKNLKVPKTWYLTSDCQIDFLHYNNYEEMSEQKYKEMEEISLEYLNIVQLFKNSHFSPEIMKGLASVIEDFGDHPIIVRSSSLLEDRMGTAFSGKYKSLFLANQGTKEERLEALMDAIGEVYASIFAPDATAYRTEKGLLDFHEEMGIMIQQVVGTRIGEYFLPSFAGVAFSVNEFRWSSRINREDGLIRMVPGLGTRAVDRVSNDYPITLAPGNPNLRVNITPDEILHYSPKRVDVINLADNRFETIELSELLKKYGDQIPAVHHWVSIHEDNHIHTPTNSFNIHFDRDNLVVSFEGLIRQTPFVKQIRMLLQILKEKMGTPVDIEFAHDGKDLYLLQCRPQSHSRETLPSPIPDSIPDDRVVFTANRYISNGSVPEISHIVYVAPRMYNQLSSLAEYQAVGRIVGKLNTILPRRKFILMGPGRWGSRGDIKLGVNVTYSDINNTSLLIEIAHKKGDYLPELSFGTHFFQDMVESSIRYLPLYPDEKNVVFNEQFLSGSPNILSEILPQYSEFSGTVHVIDVPKTTNGMFLTVLMNADIEKAVGFLKKP
ncbi:PEP/pyruvate-binding domain-containing protein [bacterium]|nr:PEP/pyruvate-binding domain-containing protein [bacterium]